MTLSIRILGLDPGLSAMGASRVVMGEREIALAMLDFAGKLVPH